MPPVEHAPASPPERDRPETINLDLPDTVLSRLSDIKLFIDPGERDDYLDDLVDLALMDDPAGHDTMIRLQAIRRGRLIARDREAELVTKQKELASQYRSAILKAAGLS